VSNKGFVTDNPYGFTDARGEHSINHANCGGRPQFLNDDLILETGCRSPAIVNLEGSLVKTLPIVGGFSYAGVSQNGKRFALQDKLSNERFTIYSMETWEPISQVTPEAPSDGQSWTAFSPDGPMFVVGSPLKLTLYRLP
jgi:hypothetical protein